MFKLLKVSQDSGSLFQVLTKVARRAGLQVCIVSNLQQQKESAALQIAAVVTQPGKVIISKKTGEVRSKPHPVQVLAKEWLPPEVILFPEKASDVRLLSLSWSCTAGACCFPNCILNAPKEAVANDGVAKYVVRHYGELKQNNSLQTSVNALLHWDVQLIFPAKR